MRVSHLEKQPQQAQLFEDKLPMAACRNWCGDFYEEATAALFRGKRLRTDSGCDVCPDVQLGPNKYLEVKSVGRGNAAMAYENRLDKDRDFVAAGNELWYAIWSHGFRVGDGASLTELRTGLASTTKALMVVPFEEFDRVLREGGLMTLNATHKARGYGSKGYQKGFRAHLKRFSFAKEGHVDGVRVYETRIGRIGMKGPWEMDVR